jgi:hypothetical protein
MTVLSA